MIRICPNPSAWHKAFKRMNRYAHNHLCTPSSPPAALILAGWAYSNDVEKMNRWDETLAWADRNGCGDLAADISDCDFYFVDTPTNYTVGSLGGPMHRRWDYDARDRPSAGQIKLSLDTLIDRWAAIVGQEIACATRPLAFTGDKAGRLLVQADASATPPWGGWAHLSKEESKRRAFTAFRAAINRAIEPHEVDHVDFTEMPSQAYPRTR